MKEEGLIANENGKAILIWELVHKGGLHAFSDILQWGYFTKWRNRYQLEKALKSLIADGLVHEKFKGHNRYGYMRYGATEKAKLNIHLIKESSKDGQ